MRSEDDYVKMDKNVDKKFQIEFICLRIWLSRGTLRLDQPAGSKLAKYCRNRCATRGTLSCKEIIMKSNIKYSQTLNF
jgi:hypothetical protein